MPDIKLQTLESIKEIVSRIDCRVFDHTFRFIIEEYKGSPQLQVIFMARDAATGEQEWQHCRKFILQYTMCDSEIIRTAYKAMQAAVMHELDEGFTFKGVRLFDPHIDLVQLSEFIKNEGKQDVRVSE